MSNLVGLMRTSADRLAERVRCIDDPDSRAGSLAWSKRELAAHLAGGTEEYVAMVTGEATVLTSLAQHDQANAHVVSAHRDAPLGELAERLRAAGYELADLVHRDPTQEVPLYEHRAPMELIGGLFIADMLVHGYDLEQLAMPDDAAGAAALLAPGILPLALLPRRRPENATLILDVRGHGATRISVESTAASVGAARPGDPADAIIRSDAESMLLLAYQRINPLQAVRRGVRFSGRRLWKLRAMQSRFQPA